MLLHLFVLDTFGAQNRPIVAFALNNVMTLKKRQAKIAQQQDAPQDSVYSGPESERDELTNRKKHQFKDVKGAAKQTLKDPQADSLPTEVYSKGEKAAKNEKASYQNKEKKELPSERNQGSLKRKAKGSKKKLKSTKGGIEQGSGGAVEGKDAATASRESKSSQLIEPKKRKLEYGTDERVGNTSPKKSKRVKKVKQPPGRDVVDKLDRLIEQYRSKFSQPSSDRSDGERQTSKQLRRWFES